MATRKIQEDFKVEVAFRRMVKELHSIAAGEGGEREPCSDHSVLLMGWQPSATCLSVSSNVQFISLSTSLSCAWEWAPKALKAQIF